jgi:hypothetical protein
MCAGPPLWILLAMAGIPAVPRGWHPCAGVHLFVFPPPLVVVELGHECGSCSVFVSSSASTWHLAADLKLLWTEGPEKLVVGIT